jgi:hypothetical protein
MPDELPPDLDPLVRQFLNGTLPKEAWTHHAHLRVGLWHVLALSREEALASLRRGICRLNEIHGTLNTPTGGYHETITRFYVLQIEKFLQSRDRSHSFADLATALIAQLPDSKLPLDYYSRELLYSVTARATWIEPDLQPLD